MHSDHELESSLTALTRDLMLIPSTAGRPSEVRRCFELVRNHLDAVPDVTLHMYERNAHESLVALPDTVRSPDILLCGHLDVIEHPQPDCYHSKVRDGKIHGPGAGDMKGQDAILIELFRDLQTRYPGISLGLALTSDEEIGGADGMRFLCDEVGLRCGHAIIPDGGSLSDVTIEEKGALHAIVRYSGKTAHGARPWLGVNAVERLTTGLAALQAHFANYWQEPKSADAEHWFPTCSITVVRTPNTTPNRIPSEAEAVIDVRFPPPHTLESIRGEIESVMGPDAMLTPLMMAEPTNLAPDERFCEITTERTGKPTRKVRASGGSDGRFLRQHGIPVNLSRPLVGNLHDLEEWIDIASMVTYYRICEQYILEKRTVAE